MTNTPVSKKLDWKHLTVAAELTHHLLDTSPAYPSRFESVMKFHAPGIAPAKSQEGAFHIDVEGHPIYQQRFSKAFGFYEGFAAVEDENGWFHINPNGSPAYNHKFAWCGNFQEERCPVRDLNGNFFHVDIRGEPIYDERYRYVGDFKDGIAVVCNSNGKSSHINRRGRLLHSKWYHQLDVFHKEFARAKDEEGWFHIDKQGNPIYTIRFAALEPFYNGRAHAETKDGSLRIIDEAGAPLHTIYQAPKNVMGDLSGDLVGFWKAETLKVALELKVLDHLPESTRLLWKKLNLPEKNLKRLLRALNEIGVIERKGEIWELTPKGKLLTPSESASMAASVIMWNEIQAIWKDLKEILEQKTISYHPTFKEQTTSPEKISCYRRAMKGYALQDFKEVVDWPDWRNLASCVTLGQTGKTLLKELLLANPNLRGVILNSDAPVFHEAIPQALKGRLECHFQNPLHPWEINTEAVLMPRFLHHFPHEEALQLLCNAHASLSTSGRLYLFEMVLDPESPSGGLLDLNLMVESGGCLRTKDEWENLLKESGFALKTFKTMKPYLHLLVATKQ